VAKKKKEVVPESEIYKVYTDGSTKPTNPGPGGYAAIVSIGDQRVELSKGYFMTTNNRMELMGIIATLEEFGPGKTFVFYTDSQHTIDCATKYLKGWSRTGWISFKTQQAIKNQDLWKIYQELLALNQVSYVKVLAHSGIPENEAADKLAKKAAENPTTVDEGYVVPLRPGYGKR